LIPCDVSYAEAHLGIHCIRQH